MNDGIKHTHIRYTQINNTKTAYSPTAQVCEFPRNLGATLKSYAPEVWQEVGFTLRTHPRIRRHGTKFRRPGDLATGISAPLPYCVPAEFSEKNTRHLTFELGILHITGLESHRKKLITGNK
jgi:hypothetical protein